MTTIWWYFAFTSKEDPYFFQLHYRFNNFETDRKNAFNMHRSRLEKTKENEMWRRMTRLNVRLHKYRSKKHEQSRVVAVSQNAY